MVLFNINAGKTSIQCLWQFIHQQQGRKWKYVWFYRSYLGIQSAGSREETKNSVFEVVREKTEDEIEWTEKKRGKGYADECFDIADAYVLANAGYIENQIESILQYYKIDDGEKDSVAKSSFLIDFIKIHIVHYIRKFLDDDSLQTVESLPKSFVDVLI